MTDVTVNQFEQIMPVEEEAIPAVAESNATSSLQDLVRPYLQNYLDALGDNEPKDLHDFVWRQIEKTLIELTLKKAGNNQCLTAKWLGIARGTLRTRMKEYGLLK